MLFLPDPELFLFPWRPKPLSGPLPSPYPPAPCPVPAVAFVDPPVFARSPLSEIPPVESPVLLFAISLLSFPPPCSPDP